ncbi:DnaJ subfamily A member 3, mitochondrial, partial [Xenoophorus captivus]
VLSDEAKRKQYDTYGTAGFEAGQAGGGQQYWSGQASHVDPEELFRKIFGEFSGGRGFGDFNAIFEQPQEVGEMYRKPSNTLLVLKCPAVCVLAPLLTFPLFPM